MSYPKALSDYQDEVRAWADRNFPKSSDQDAFEGIVEELGELSRARLKRRQGIRGEPVGWLGKEMDALGDILVYMLDYAGRRGIDLQACLELAWHEVKQRDWIKFPKNGRTE
jgi:NTP pyrophosphatase (non-canonical NTP hydrolase)